MHIIFTGSKSSANKLKSLTQTTKINRTEVHILKRNMQSKQNSNSSLDKRIFSDWYPIFEEAIQQVIYANISAHKDYVRNRFTLRKKTFIGKRIFIVTLNRIRSGSMVSRNIKIELTLITIQFTVLIIRFLANKYKQKVFFFNIVCKMVLMM